MAAVDTEVAEIVTTEVETDAVAAVDTEVAEIVTIEVEIVETTEAVTGEKEETTTDHLVENTRVAMTEGRNVEALENPVDGVLRISVGLAVAEIRRGVFI